jgi:hypothetical protein
MAEEKHATPHAMHTGNDLLLYVDRTIEQEGSLCRAPSVNATGPEKMVDSHLVIIGPRLAADRKTTQAPEKKKSNSALWQGTSLIWQSCTALRWAALASPYPFATLRTLSTRRLGTQVYRWFLGWW